MRASATSLEGFRPTSLPVMTLAPQGPKGLWKALAAASPSELTEAEDRAFRFATSIGPIGDLSPVDLGAPQPEFIDLAGTEAAMAYLSRATFVRGGELTPAMTPAQRSF